MIDHSRIPSVVNTLMKSRNKESIFKAYQLMFNLHEPCYFVENFLVTNENKPQSLAGFPMMKPIYNSVPKRLLLKCSRKTLKSTFLSNFIALNMVRWNNYKMLYVGPMETSVNYFSSNYVNGVFSSPKIRSILPIPITAGKWDIKEKHLMSTNSMCLFRYCSDDATRLRGPATDHNLYDEIQDIDDDQLPIINETMSMSEFSREIFSGTPLTSDNTIDLLWKKSTQNEWMFKCEHCPHWNSLTPDNDLLSMIGVDSLLCSKCHRPISSRNGEWVTFNESEKDFIAYHLAQPILPFYNERANKWEEVYQKVHKKGYGLFQIYNEVFGLSFDVGSKPITEEALRALCTLGPMHSEQGKYDILERLKYRYSIYACGVDWGVNQTTSRTASCFAAMRDNGTIDVWFCKIHDGFEYKSHIREIADLCNHTNSFCASDSGPSPDRGIELVEATSTTRTQLIRYEHGKVIERTSMSPDGRWQGNRWCLHRSDVMTVIFNMLKNKRINFPQWEDCAPCMKDILNIFIEVKEGAYRQELFYRHKPTAPDDFMHALCWAICQLLKITNDPILQGNSSSTDNDSTYNDN